MNQFWAILELMGHVRLGGLVSEEEKFGVKMGRIDVPDQSDSGFVTQYFGGSSVYRLTPCTEEVARAVAKYTAVQPVHSYELPRLSESRSGEGLTVTTASIHGEYDEGREDDDGEYF